MKRFFFTILTCLTLFAFTGFSKETTNEMSGKVEITLSYEKQDGRGSNQYAVWIEDNQGKLIKTLFITKFTAQGGWEKRPACTPIWVKKSDIANLSQQEIDGFTGATPATGVQTYVWDGTDTTGKKVKPGIYTFVVEATLINDNYTLFRGEINTTGVEAITTTVPEYNKKVDTHTNMVTNVAAHFIP